MQPASPRTSVWVERAAGAAILLWVIWIYSGAITHQQMPPGHPWSGATLTCLAVTALAWPSARWSEASKASRTARVLAALLALAAAVMWIRSALLAPPTNYP